MKTIILLICLVSLTHCIDDDSPRARLHAQYVAKYKADIEAHKPDACNVCIVTFRQVMVEIDGFTQRCVQYTDDQTLCCPQRGDVGCPLGTIGYELDQCSDSINGVCQDSGHADEDCVPDLDACDG